MMHTEESEVDLSKLEFGDDYVINKVYSHAFYIDQWTENATRCYQDNCNTKVRFRSKGSNISSQSLGVLLGTVLLVASFNQIFLKTDYSIRLLSTN